MLLTHCRRIGVSVVKLKGTAFVTSHTFQRKPYISIARTGNLITYALGPFSRKRSHMPFSLGFDKLIILIIYNYAWLR